MKRIIASSLFFASVASGQLVINEILFDPGSDANGDGTENFSDDEFVELVNTSAVAVNMEGWSLSDGAGVRHVFPPGTVLAPGQAIVVFGGGSPAGDFGGSLVQIAVSDTFQGNALGLNNTVGDMVSISDQGGVEVVAYTYVADDAADESLVRSPDLTGPEPLVAHSAVPEANGEVASPGRLLDGSLFIEGAVLSLSIDPMSFPEGGGDTAATGTVTRTGDTSSALTVSLFSGNMDLVGVPVSVDIAVGMTSATFPISAVDDEVQEFSSSVYLGAVADGFLSAGVIATVLDDEPDISLSADLSEISENGGVATITITVSESRESGYSFDLFTSDDLVLTVPNTAMIAGGETSVTVEATAVDNMEAGIPQVIEVTVTDVDLNLFDETINIVVTDDEGLGVPPLFISEIADPGNFNGRFVELYNAGDSELDLDAGNWNLVLYANGTLNARTIVLSGIIPAKTTFVVVSDLTEYGMLYPTAPAANQDSGTLSYNGDDTFELYLGGGVDAGILVDVYGVTGVDGTGENWEYTDSRVVRVGSVTEPNAAFTIGEWMIQGMAEVEDMTPGVYDVIDVMPTTRIEIGQFVIDPSTGQGSVIFADGASATGYSIQVSSDLNQSDPWAAVATQTQTDNQDGTLTINFTDASAVGEAKRFYRIEEGGAISAGFSGLPPVFPDFPAVVAPPAPPAQ